MTSEESEILKKIDVALFQVPSGSPAGTKPLIEGMRIMWMAYQRGSWVARALIWLLPTVALLGASYEKIIGWLR